ncbi:type II secretion system protein GspL [Marinobacter shengliensis]|uniref:type II secretion system protein GspL n=1 Tax=Marinobacter shengliensis TaxID=1389223 RepID=UPI0025722E5A|nr:type II secretion system protein GspL [Marinobacter shengliensis]BEH14741.1 type II secretion system protein L [Marinobacter shengliensis]
MSYRLFVRPVPPFADLDQNPESQLFSWLLQDASGDTQASGAADTRDAIEQTLGQNALEKVLLIGLIPGDEALFCLADIPAKQSRFVHQALPYAVEEQIAQDIESVHLALGRHTSDGYHVAAIDQSQMGQWLELFTGWEHVRLDAIYPDASLLPTTDNGWTACLDGEWAMLVSHRGEWLRLQTANLGMLGVTLAAPATEEVVAEIPVTVYGTEPELELWQPALLELSGADGRVHLAQKPLEFTALELLAWSHHHHMCHPVNLCQGAFSVKTNGSSPLKPWKPLIAVASVWFVIQLGLEIGMGVYHNQEAEELQSQAMAIYRDAFPADRRTHARNVRRVIEGQLRVAGAGREEVDFITLMKYTGDQYSRVANAQAVTFNSINYSRNRGELVVDVRADSYERMSNLRNGLANQGLRAQIGSVVNESSGSRGRLTVSGG